MVYCILKEEELAFAKVAFDIIVYGICQFRKNSYDPIYSHPRTNVSVLLFRCVEFPVRVRVRFGVRVRVSMEKIT